MFDFLEALPNTTTTSFSSLVWRFFFCQLEATHFHHANNRIHYTDVPLKEDRMAQPASSLETTAAPVARKTQPNGYCQPIHHRE